MSEAGEVPQVVGFPYLAAQARVRAAGLVMGPLQVTRPPRARAGRGQLRVIQQRHQGDEVRLTLAYEDYDVRG